MKKVDFTGTVSHATMRPEDLIPAFMDVLEKYNPQKAKKLAEDFSYTGNVEELSTEDQTWLIDGLFDALDEIAPDNHYFGSHPGDGSDYGFWTFEF